MKKAILVMAMLLFTIGYSQQQEYLLDFEPNTPSGVASNWYTFDNNAAPAEIIDNPDLDGTNASSSKVLKVVVGPDNAFYAGVNNAWDEGAFGTWEIEMGVPNNLTVTMDVHKNYVGTLGIKMATASEATTFQITTQNVGNTVVDEWQTLSWDLSGINPNGDLTNISQMVVFVDWTQGLADRAENSTIYIDNIRFNAKKLTDAPTAGLDDYTKTSVKMFPNPANGVVNFYSVTNAVLKVTIYDMLGKQVLRSDRVQTQLNISSLNPGMYFVNMTIGQQNTTNKLVVH